MHATFGAKGHCEGPRHALRAFFFWCCMSIRAELDDDGPVADAREEYDCGNCGTWWWSEPQMVECEACRETLCPRCEPVVCECGGTFCQTCAVLVEVEGQEIYLCPDCRSDFGVCDRCEESLPEIIFPQSAGDALFLCPACSLAMLDEAA